MSTSGPPRSPTRSLATVASRARGQHPVDAVVHLAPDRLRAARRPGEAGHGDRIRMHLAVGVAEARVRVGPADGPVEGERDLRAHGGDRGRPVEVRGRVEVPGQEDGNPLRDEPRQDVELRLGRRQPRPALERVQLLGRGAVPNPVRAVRGRGEVRVGDRHDLARAELDVDVEPVARRAGRSAGSGRRPASARWRTSRGRARRDAWSARPPRGRRRPRPRPGSSPGPWRTSPSSRGASCTSRRFAGRARHRRRRC